MALNWEACKAFGSEEPHYYIAKEGTLYARVSPKGDGTWYWVVDIEVLGSFLSSVDSHFGEWASSAEEAKEKVEDYLERVKVILRDCLSFVEKATDDS